jgi:hypothetical protein
MVGDHIRALRAGRWTHAIDLGDNTVLAASEPAADGAGDGERIRRLYRPHFEEGADSVEVVTHRERTYAGKVVAARAFSRLREPALAIMFRDSEAFAAWCKTGRLPEGPRNVAVAVRGGGAKRKAAGATRRAARSAARPAAKPAARARPARAKGASRRPAPKWAASERKPARKAAPAPARKRAAGRKAKRAARRGEPAAGKRGGASRRGKARR